MRNPQLEERIMYTTENTDKFLPFEKLLQVYISFLVTFVTQRIFFDQLFSF